MAQENNQQQDQWTQGVSQFREAIEHNMTATRLLTTGAIALGAAATAYFWDSSRRNAFLESSRRMGEGMTSWWSGMASGGTNGGTTGSTGTANS